VDSQIGIWTEVDEEGRLVIPAELVERYGLGPGAPVWIEKGKNDVRLHRPVTDLKKIYIEPTNQCNIACRMCMRNSWDEPSGWMSSETFDVILENLENISPMPIVSFGGLGEPLAHPDFIDMVVRVKKLGGRVEMITNGTLLDERRSRQLVDGGLDMVWVSIDGASPESYADVRLGAALPEVLANLDRLRELRESWTYFPTPEIGITFVAMKRNIADLPEVIKMGRRVGAKHFMVSHVLPYTAEMQAERLYARMLRNITYMPSLWVPQLNLPKMNLNENTQDVFIQLLNSSCNVTFAGNNLGGSNDVCTFIQSGSMAIGWDGSASPCLPLLHNHISYLHGKPRRSRRHIIGNIKEHSMLALWQDPDYVAYRKRVQSFAFAPCTSCGGCDLSEANEEDCFGITFPACGGCLWAQGVIQCP
jgi:MoaA/NifB/PqqE/SkfB family radical SAM enzyme